MKTVSTIIRPKALPLLSVLLTMVFILVSCGGGERGARKDNGAGDTVSMKYAEQLSMENRPGYVEVTVRNPWDTIRTLQRYFLVPRDSALPAGLPHGVVVRVPLRNALVYSTVHHGLISELGAIDAVGGVCNAEYVYDKELASRIATGRVADCGNAMNPDMERIISMRPDAILLSPYENNDRYAKVGELGIPVIECADYMETSALGRAEWMRFYGLLFGKGEASDSLFAATEKSYLQLKEIASAASTRPKVIMDQRYGQTWNVPGGMSTMGRLIEDAGGTNPFADLKQSGSVPLSPEKVLADAHDADVWLLRYNQPADKSLAELKADAPVNARFRAYKQGNVYGCNTRYVRFYEETPFHPDRLLGDMIRIIHPEISAGDPTLHYFHKLK